ncbi:MAG: PepSY-like domain-containing protein [Tannerellaceae bacterium]|nr:PepSY-like domain-containing protein [Tannerellaceae bacterium]
MKKIIAAVICLFTIQLSAQADDKRIQYNQLPSNAREFIEEHYKDAKVQEVIEDDEWMGMDKSYEVRFTNGDKIEFNSKGEWEDMKKKNGTIPEHLVPAQINTYVN